MSFARAKLQRFNDIKVCTPSPAKYIVSQENKAKNNLFAQFEKFTKKDSPNGSETGSQSNIPCFQTPTVPKKKRLLTLSLTKSKSTDKELLNEKIVECNSKDVYIKELIQRLDENKIRIADLLNGNDELNSQIEELRNEFLNLRRSYRQVLNDFNNLTSENEAIRSDLQQIGLDYKDFNTHIENELENLTGAIKLYQEVHQQKELELKELSQSEIEVAKREWQEQKEKELESLRLLLETRETKLKILEERVEDGSVLNWRLKLEEQQKESAEILKECQAISEYNIITCEVEKNNLKIKLAEKEAILEDLNGQHHELIDKYTKMFEKCQELELKRDEAIRELSNSRIDKHAYDVYISTSSETIEVLKRRLINSDRDVEQLKLELTNNELKLVEYESRNAELQTQLDNLQQDHYDLELQFESTLKLEVAQLEATVMSQIGELEEQIERQKLKSLDREQNLHEAIEQLSEQQVLNSRANVVVKESQVLLESLENDFSKAVKHNMGLEQELEGFKNLVEVYKLEQEEASEIRKKYIEISGRYDDLTQNYESVLKDLGCSVEDSRKLEEQIGELVEVNGLLQKQMAESDSEIRVLMGQNGEFERENRELNEKYGELIGHQNRKHLAHLQQNYGELFQRNLDLETKNYELNKNVEKLKKELIEARKSSKKIRHEDKENLGSPRVGRVESPGPLKEKHLNVSLN